MPARTWVRQLVASALVSAAAAQSLEWTAIPYPSGDAQVRNDEQQAVRTHGPRGIAVEATMGRRDHGPVLQA